MVSMASNMRAIEQEVLALPEEQALRQLALCYLNRAQQGFGIGFDREHDLACFYLKVWIEETPLIIGLRLRKVNLAQEHLCRLFFQGPASSSSSGDRRPYVFRMVNALSAAS